MAVALKSTLRGAYPVVGVAVIFPFKATSTVQTASAVTLTKYGSPGETLKLLIGVPLGWPSNPLVFGSKYHTVSAFGIALARSSAVVILDMLTGKETVLTLVVAVVIKLKVIWSGTVPEATQVPSSVTLTKYA